MFVSVLCCDIKQKMYRYEYDFNSRTTVHKIRIVSSLSSIISYYFIVHSFFVGRSWLSAVLSEQPQSKQNSVSQASIYTNRERQTGREIKRE